MHAAWSSALSLLAVAARLVTGWLVAVARIQAFIVSLSMMVFARGLAKQLS